MNKLTSLLAIGLAASLPLAAAANDPVCKQIHADLVEVRTSEGCNPGLSFCFLGEVDGNHGLRGTTHFRGDSSAAGPVTGLPGFISYSGPFQYRTATGNLDMRETGITNTLAGVLQSGRVTAYQQVVDGSGEFAGATGFLFVSGRNVGGVITTTISGELCLAQ